MVVLAPAGFVTGALPTTASATPLKWWSTWNLWSHNFQMADAPEPPSGRQFEIVKGPQQAVVTEVGATLRRYRAGGLEALDGFETYEICSAGRGQPLLPWPNRIRDGRYTFAGEDHQLPINEVERGNAIHGLTRWEAWQSEEHTDERLLMRHRLHPQPGYPFDLDLTIEYTLSEDGLSVTMTAVNLGAGPCPFGAGAHPYLRVGGEVIDSATLQLPAETRLESDERAIPVGRSRVEGTEFDFLTAREIGDTALDTGYADLRRDPDGRARAILSALGGPSLTLWVDETYPYLMVFTGDPLEPQRRRRGLAIEPMTCPPNAFQSGEALLVLQPGERFMGSWGITPDLTP
jgi:aldose 1-epimerase